MIATYGDEGITYRYSGTIKHAAPWTEDMLLLKKRVEEATDQRYNFALFNLYRNGNDYIGPHSDDERDLVPGSYIASISLGAERDFVFHHRIDKKKEASPGGGGGGATTKKLTLPSGSLLCMGENCQKNYKHSVPKRSHVHSPRINITFRLIDNGKTNNIHNNNNNNLNSKQK
eukprot:GEZU01001330.1.p1 GENE.GEZU01001330.1~~GEZU01001330.1.p1  ORF type:complete len:173 (+),score=39.75 GEZU01001330.1:252-770(+)